LRIIFRAVVTFTSGPSTVSLWQAHLGVASPDEDRFKARDSGEGGAASARGFDYELAGYEEYFH